MEKKQKREYKILLTGGHAVTTAIAVIEEIKRRYADSWRLYWVGPRSAVEGKYVPTLASQAMGGVGVVFLPITTGRLQRKFTRWTILSLMKIPIGILQAFKIIFKIRPSVVISFGGYASVPVSFAAWVFGIPIFIHEQTVAVGRANKIISFFAKKIFIARSESEFFFPREKTVLIGNPVSLAIANIKIKTKIGNPPTLYITGGSSGAQRINAVVGDTLYELLKKYKVIHQTGRLDFKEFKKRREVFPTDLKRNYEVYDFIDPKKVAKIFEEADIIVSRAGANIVSEIMLAKRPAILIPIPWTSYNEQTKNARLLVKSGLGVLLEEGELNSKNLIGKLDFVFENWEKMVLDSDSSLAELDRGAAGKFVDGIYELLNGL